MHHVTTNNSKPSRQQAQRCRQVISGSYHFLSKRCTTTYESFRSRHTAKPARPEPSSSNDAGSGTPDTTPRDVIWLLTANDKIFPRASTSTMFIPPVLVKILCEKLPLTSALTSPRLWPNGVTVMPDSL